VIGKTLRIEGHPVTVIGVLPPGMRFPQIALGAEDRLSGNRRRRSAL
jgi:hypothetical protein